MILFLLFVGMMPINVLYIWQDVWLQTIQFCSDYFKRSISECHTLYHKHCLILDQVLHLPHGKLSKFLKGCGIAQLVCCPSFMLMAQVQIRVRA